MFLKKIVVNNVRNIKEAVLEPEENINLIVGENGSGKTSLLESIDILSRGRSFRSNKIAEVQRKNTNSMAIGGILDNGIKIQYKRENAKVRLYLNSNETKKQSDVSKNIAVQSIYPNSHQLIEGPPSERRSYLDWGLFHVEQNYRDLWSEYTKTLKQRNEALKSQKGNLAPWTEKLAASGEKITSSRKAYFENITKGFFDYFEEFLPHANNETPLSSKAISLYFSPGWDINQSSLFDAIEKNLKKDLEKGFTSVGPHCADIRLKLGETDACKIISRGQQKLIVCALLMAQFKDYNEKTSNKSIIIIDELASELTLELQAKVLEKLLDAKSQVFISALTDSSLAEILSDFGASVFHVEHGEIFG